MRGIYRDRRDRLRASPDVFPSVLADFLETDVRDNPAWCEELLRGLERASDGREKNPSVMSCVSPSST